MGIKDRNYSHISCLANRYRDWNFGMKFKKLANFHAKVDWVLIFYNFDSKLLKRKNQTKIISSIIIAPSHCCYPTSPNWPLPTDPSEPPPPPPLHPTSPVNHQPCLHPQSHSLNPFCYTNLISTLNPTPHNPFHYLPIPSSASTLPPIHHPSPQPHFSLSFSLLPQITISPTPIPSNSPSAPPTQKTTTNPLILLQPLILLPPCGWKSPPW